MAGPFGGIKSELNTKLIDLRKKYEKSLPRIVAFNTSFVNDCHDSQLHEHLSESAAIIRKAMNLCDIKKILLPLDESLPLDKNDETFDARHKKFD